MYVEIFNKGMLHEAICNENFLGNNVVTMLRQFKTFSEHCYNTQNIALSLRSVPSFISIRPLLEGRDNTFIFSNGSHVNETPSGTGLPKKFWIIGYIYCTIFEPQVTRRDSQTL